MFIKHKDYIHYLAFHGEFLNVRNSLNKCKTHQFEICYFKKKTLKYKVSRECVKIIANNIFELKVQNIKIYCQI